MPHSIAHPSDSFDSDTTATNRGRHVTACGDPHLESDLVLNPDPKAMAGGQIKREQYHTVSFAPGGTSVHANPQIGVGFKGPRVTNETYDTINQMPGQATHWRKADRQREPEPIRTEQFATVKARLA